MLGLGLPELLVIFAIFLLFFGASKLPTAGSAIGKGIRNFKKAMNGEEDIDVTPKKKKKKALTAGDDDEEDDSDATEVDEEEDEAEEPKVKEAAAKK